jgi:hypothetical protein
MAESKAQLSNELENLRNAADPKEAASLLIEFISSNSADGDPLLDPENKWKTVAGKRKWWNKLCSASP